MSVSIAQLCFTAVFLQVLSLAASSDARYYEAAPPAAGIVWALLLDIVILALIAFLFFRLRASGIWALRLIGTTTIPLLSLFAGYQVLRSTGEYLQAWMDESAALYITIAIGTGIAVAFTWSWRRAFRAVEVAFLVMSPLCPIAASNAIWDYRLVDANAFGKGSAAGMLHGNSHGNRVIWIVFDELDQRMLFEARPHRVHLEEFDAFRAQSIYATQASSPNGNTLPSLQSLILGRKVREVKLDSNDLAFKFEGCLKWQRFGSYPNVFSQARAAGYDTGLSGWDHPYCRVIGKDLSDCAWEVSPQAFIMAEKALASRSFFQKALYLVEWQAQSFPYRRKFGIVTEPGGVAEIKLDTIDTFRYVMANAERMLNSPFLNLVLIHLPVPHPPGIWDTRRTAFTAGESDYVDNLQLANDSLGRLRRLLERNGNWDSSTILISSDHPYRAEFWQNIYFIKTEEMTDLTQMRSRPFIPFLLKLPRQHTEVTYTKRFNSVLTSELLLGALRADIATPEDAGGWLDQHSDASLNANSGYCK